MPKHDRCPKFGWGFELEDEYCRSCNKILDCSEQTIKARIAIQAGEKPNIPIIKDSSIPKVYVEKPKEMDGKVLFAFRIDSKWLKEQLGWDKKNGSKNEN